jgi:hypothetical protein
MKHLLLLLLFIVVGSGWANAGEIFGALTDKGKSVGPGVKIEIALPDTAYQALTDKFGSYRVFVPHKGKCTLKIHYKDQLPSIEIQALEKAVRYDLLLEIKDGKYQLKRK